MRPVKSEPPDSIRLNLLDPTVRDAVLVWWTWVAGRNEPVTRSSFVNALNENLATRGVLVTGIDTSAIWTFVYPDWPSTNIRSNP